MRVCAFIEDEIADGVLGDFRRNPARQAIRGGLGQHSGGVHAHAEVRADVQKQFAAEGRGHRGRSRTHIHAKDTVLGFQRAAEVADDLSLGGVARAVNMSSFYFCKMFKKATGVNFTDFLSRVRIEKAKNLLLNPNLRISEIAYEVGFQSLTHFNRMFKRILGLSPTEYREQLPAGAH